MNAEQALQYLCSQAKALGADSFDAFAGYGRSTGLNAFAGKVQNTEISESVGVGIRLFRDGRPGYASTERLTPESLQQTIKDALEHARFTDPIGVAIPSPQPLEAPLVKYSEELEGFSLERMAQEVLAIEAMAQESSQEIANIPYLGAGRSESQSWFANSEGIFHTERENDFSIGTGVVAVRDNVSKLGVYSRSGRSLSLLDAKAIAKTAVERALELLGARPVAGGDYPIVFSNRVSGQIFSLFASCFFAEVVQKGQSRMAGKLGQLVASPVLQVYSDPTCADLPGASRMDGEGVPCKKQQIISDGILNNFLHNLESAAREGVASTGNASRSYSGRVGTTFHNLVVPVGGNSLQDLLRAHSRCLYIVKLEGASGCSSVSGQISIGAQGFLVEQGQVVHPVDGITLSGNFFDLLPQIGLLGDQYNDSFSSVRVPDLLVNSMGVSS